MTKFLKSHNSGYKYPLPPGFHLIYDLVPFFKMVDHFQNTNLSPAARKRLKWMDYYWECRNVSQTCRHFDIPRKTFYYWLKRYDPHNLSLLQKKEIELHTERDREKLLPCRNKELSLSGRNISEKVNLTLPSITKESTKRKSLPGRSRRSLRSTISITILRRQLEPEENARELSKRRE